MDNDNKRSDDSLSEEASAFGERVKGAAKDGIGSITGNRRLEREGEMENAEGRVRQATNNVFDETDGVRGATAGGRGDVRNSDPRPVTTPGTPPNSIREETAAFGERMKGAVKDGVGSMTGNRRLEREGEIENAQGRARQASNDAVNAPGTPRTWDSKWSREHLVTGLYDSPDTARKAYDDLTKRHGYKDDDISVVMTLASKVTVLDAGRLLAEGSPEAISADERVREAYLGTARHDELFSEG